MRLTIKSLLIEQVIKYVKLLILIVSQLDGTPDGIDENSTLDELGFNRLMCDDLAQRLNRYVKSINPSASVNNSEIDLSTTVQEVIDLILQKLPL